MTDGSGMALKGLRDVKQFAPGELFGMSEAILTLRNEKIGESLGGLPDFV